MQQVQCNTTRKIWKFTLIIQLEYSPSLETNFKSSVVRVSCQPKYNNHINYYYYYCNNINKYINNKFSNFNHIMCPIYTKQNQNTMKKIHTVVYNCIHSK